VATALRYFDLNLGWQPVSIAGRLTARRLPDEPFEPAFTDFKSFLVADEPAYDRNLIMDDVTQRYLAD
jgi:hypothetical protein